MKKEKLKKDFSVVYRRIRRSLPFIAILGLSLLICSSLLFLMETNFEIWIILNLIKFNFTKDFWKMMFFFGLTLVGLTGALYMLKYFIWTCGAEY